VREEQGLCWSEGVEEGMALTAGFCSPSSQALVARMPIDEEEEVCSDDVELPLDSLHVHSHRRVESRDYDFL
jgi:hypothetical protein